MALVGHIKCSSWFIVVEVFVVLKYLTGCISADVHISECTLRTFTGSIHLGDLWSSWRFVVILEIYGHLGDVWSSWRFMVILEIYGHLGDLWSSWRFMAILEICGHLGDL